MIKSDLHFHSYYSDGLCSPEFLAKRAKALGIQVVALTDHDSIEGVTEMKSECDKLGVKNINGIEFSTFMLTEVHILGYGFNVTKEFKEFVTVAEETRLKRIVAVLDKLREHKIDISLEEIKKLAKGNVSRMHISKVMVDKGYEKESKAAFEKWLIEGAPCYVSDFRPNPNDVIQVIKNAGGQAVLAHPMRIKAARPDILNIIDNLKKMGLNGIESEYKFSAQETKKYYREAATLRGLFVTGGSDYHGTQGDLIPIPISEKVIDILADNKTE